MTDVTTTDAPEPSSESGTEPVPAETSAPETAEAGPPERPSFLHRPLVEKFLVPLLLPIAVILFVVVYVINISRIFLAGHGHIPIFSGTFILATILFGSAILSAASPRLRQATITLISVGFILLVISSGWLLIGHAQPEKAAATSLPATLKTKQTLSLTAGPGGNLVFQPNALTATTGLATMKITVGSGGHTFNFKNPDVVLWPGEPLTPPGGTVTGTVFFPAPGDYGFFCVPHQAAGMQGTIHVTGPTVTLTQALTAAGNPASAAG